MGANYKDVAAPAEVPAAVHNWLKHRYERMGKNGGCTASDKVCKQIISHLNSLHVYVLKFPDGGYSWRIPVESQNESIKKSSLKFTFLGLYSVGTGIIGCTLGKKRVSEVNFHQNP